MNRIFCKLCHRELVNGEWLERTEEEYESRLEKDATIPCRDCLKKKREQSA